VVKLELPVVLVSLNEEELVVVKFIERTPVGTELPVDVKVTWVSPDEEPAVLEVTATLIVGVGAV
jgi:hypothetical protein